MTTERREPRARMSPVELRLYVIGMLAAVYAISWRAIGGHAAPPEPAQAVVPESSPRFVWLDSIPPGTRPTIALPTGWQIASEPTPQSPRAAPQSPRVVRAPARRVRTRSS